jgi:transposase
MRSEETLLTVLCDTFRATSLNIKGASVVAATNDALLLKRHNAQRLEQIKRHITAIEAEILKQVQTDRDLARRFAILTSIPGLSAITAFALLIEMPELGALEQGQAASLAALRPSRDNPAGGSDAPSSAAAGRASARPSTCQRSSPPDSIQT